MNITTFISIIESSRDHLLSEEIKAIYIYGSQVPVIDTSLQIPKGKEVDLVFVKRGHLRDGEQPISSNVAEQIFHRNNDVIHRFNGIWGDLEFEQGYYYFDIIGEGLANLTEMTPSAKIFAIKDKFLVWGELDTERWTDTSLSLCDIQFLSDLMSNYVNREFSALDNFQSRKSIYKNGIFLISMLDRDALTKSTRDDQIEAIRSSEIISNTLKLKSEELQKLYLECNHSRLLHVFNLVSTMVKNG